MVRFKGILAALAAGLTLGAGLSTQNTQAPQKPEPQQVIRATTNLIQVDAYPTREGPAPAP